MPTSSLVTFALSVTAVSAMACRKPGSTPNTKLTDTSGAYCQFPSSIDCPVNGGIHITNGTLIQAVVNADRSGRPVEYNAANTACGHCATPNLHNIPYWTVSFSWAIRGIWMKPLC